MPVLIEFRSFDRLTIGRFSRVEIVPSANGAVVHVGYKVAGVAGAYTLEDGREYIWSTNLDAEQWASIEALGDNIQVTLAETGTTSDTAGTPLFVYEALFEELPE